MPDSIAIFVVHIMVVLLVHYLALATPAPGPSTLKAIMSLVKADPKCSWS